MPHWRAAAIAVLSVVMVGLVQAPPAQADIKSDQARIQTLEQKMIAQGAHIKSLVGQYNQLQTQLATIRSQIAHDQEVLTTDARAVAAASATATRVALRAYIMSGSTPTLGVLGSAGDVTTAAEGGRYLGAVNNNLQIALDTLRVNEDRTKADRGKLQSAEKLASDALAQVTRAHDAANAAINQDQALLTGARGDLRTLLVQEARRREQAEAAQERALAAAAAAAAPVPAVDPPPSTNVQSPPPPISSPAGYANPLRAIGGLASERIDQGVDYAGFGPIYAIGSGVVLATSVPGWPGGTFIAYRLTSGPAAGLVVYSAEDISPNVQVGESVTTGTVLGQVYEGPDGIEVGWADPNGLGYTMAHTHGQFHGDNSTAFGANFSQLLQSVGAPGGILQNNPTGSLPSGWPRW